MGFKVLGLRLAVQDYGFNAVQGLGVRVEKGVGFRASEAVRGCDGPKGYLRRPRNFNKI